MFLQKVAEQLVARASLHHPDYYNSILKLRNSSDLEHERKKLPKVSFLKTVDEQTTQKQIASGVEWNERFSRRGICSYELEEETGVIAICTRKKKMPIRQLNGSGYYSPTCI